MTTAHLIESIAAELREATAGVKLPSEYEALTTAEPTFADCTTVNIFEQRIPLDLFEQTSYYPAIIVELVKLTDDLKAGTTATVAVSVGVYAKEANGWKDAFHLMEVVRGRLLSKRVLAKRFRLTDEATWTPPPEQPAPFEFLTGELTYQLYQTREDLT